MRDWVRGTPADDWVSMAVASDGSYGVKEGIVYSYPVRCVRGDYQIVQGLSVDDFAQAKMAATEAELRVDEVAEMPV